MRTRKTVPKAFFTTGLFHHRKCPALYFAQIEEFLLSQCCCYPPLQACSLRAPRPCPPYLCLDRKVHSPAANRKAKPRRKFYSWDTKTPSNADCATTSACYCPVIRPLRHAERDGKS